MNIFAWILICVLCFLSGIVCAGIAFLIIDDISDKQLIENLEKLKKELKNDK